jgi:DMSO/TMAO reductase YedYZ molybdopterin-dependent catalytic subunit
MFLLGSGPVLPVALLHGLLGLAVVVLVPWKSVVVRRGLKRNRGPRRVSSLVLLVMVVLALVTGVAHLGGLLVAGTPLTSLQVHVGAGVVALVLTLVHARHRPVRGRRADLSRRSLLRLGLLASAAGVLDAGLRGAGALAVPRGARRATGSVRLASSAVAAVPATSWLFDRVPSIDECEWRLTVTADGGSRTWSLADLGRWDDHLTAVLDCTGGWWTEQEWSGVRVDRLLPPGARGSVEVTSATGYSRRLPLTADLLLATAVGGMPLAAGHGHPARLVVPGRRGYHWVKWVTRISLDERPWWLEPPLPLR